MQEIGEGEEIIELEDIIEEHPQLVDLQEELIRNPVGLYEDNDPNGISEGLEVEFDLEEIEKTEEKSLGEMPIYRKTEFVKELDIKGEHDIDWASEEDSTIPEVIDEEIKLSGIPEASLPDQEIRDFKKLDNKTAEGIIRAVSREVIENVAREIIPEIRVDLLETFDEKLEQIAMELFPPIAEKIIKEEIEKLKEE